MSTYSAPLKDMRFAIEELAGLSEVAALPGHGEVNAELVEAVLGEAGKFAQEVLDPLNREGDRQGARLSDGAVTAPKGFKEAYRQFVEAGWNGLGGEPEYGGQGLPHLIATPVQEIWKSANMALCLAPMLTSGVLEALRAHASPEQLKTYAGKLTSGVWTGTMNLTEPQAGSDLSAVRTRAVREGGHYRIQGTKIFITWGEHDLSENIIHLVLARTPDAPEGVKGISLFIVPKFLPKPDGTPGERNDVKCVSIEHKLGIRGSPTCVLAYGDRKGAIGHLVGEENRGLEYMFTMMNHARLAVGVEGVAAGERAYQHALEYARTRVQGREIGQRGGDRVTIIHHPDVRRMLMSMRAQTEAMRALAYFAAATLDKARRHPDPAEKRRNQSLLDLLTPVVKGWCTEQGVEVASTGIQVHGGMGFIEETGATQYLRDARITTIYEGTTGIQANDLVGRKVALEKGATANAMIGAMRALEPTLASAGETYLRDGLKESVDGLEAATHWIVRTHAGDPRAVAGVAVPYLKLFGTVAGGWMMARAALIAHEKRKQPDADRDFLDAKLATARFFAEHELPKALPLAREVTRGADSVLALAPEKF
ncbi:MAG: acyl-CoA dehydrogenase [Betaproteobacteria bacterium RIFCSPLOWO2_02_FULL_67_26]|nr:MAG: acyl-CoA dehydrogenase [Betaproteobacteria bacterium RIFCSPLOWO2_02_FULL_67_26]